MKLIVKTLALTLTLSLSSCSDELALNTEPDSAPARLILDMAPVPDIPVLSADPIPDMEPPQDSCLGATVLDPLLYCRCNPDCCLNQRWYCPPNPSNTIDAMDVIVEICDESGLACNFGVDPGCPPPEIIFRSECYVAHECPPGSSGEFLQWFECQMEDGSIGRQRVLCNKGSLVHGPCQACVEETCNGTDDDCDNITDEGRFACSSACGDGWGFCVDSTVVDCTAPEPLEEACDYEDNDCDGEVDEGQRNVCDECGNVAQDNCDGLDNDCDGSVDEDLSQVCETVCGIGVEFCSDGSWIGCTARAPADEDCNGQDDDCDGLIDEGLECNCSLEDIGVLTPCSEPPLVCGFGFKTCECQDPPDCNTLRMSQCQAICTYVPVQQELCDPLTGMALPTEFCNNFDDDCDAITDEDLTRECYTGPPNTLNIGVCSPGRQVCIEGIWGELIGENWAPDFCADETLPTVEVCDGADNDCDGEVDYGEEVRQTDVLLIVDRSGSMDGEVGAVMHALSRFANQFSAEDAIHWGLIITPANHRAPGVGVKEHMILISDILPFNDFFMRFGNINFPIDGGSEQLLDALYASVYPVSANTLNVLQDSIWEDCCASMPEIQNFIINWRPDSDKIIITFSDEEPFTYMEPENTLEIVQLALAATPELVVHTFSQAHYEPSWGRLAIATGGLFFQLTQNSEQMYSDLVSIIDQACLPRE